MHHAVLLLAATLSFTPTTAEAPTDFDVVVVGDGIGGVGAAVAAAREGSRVALLTFTDYPGGQASAGAVSTFDEGSPLLRTSGLYRQLVADLTAGYGSAALGGCYFSVPTLCPEPDIVAATARAWLDGAGVTVVRYTRLDDVVQVGTTVTGVVADGVAFSARVVVDATERSDLYPLVEGLSWVAGDGCVQDMTWPVVVSWYPDGVAPELVVPPTARDDLAAVWGTETVDSWLRHFRTLVVADPGPRPPASGMPPLPWTWAEEVRYRAVADLRTLPHPRPPQTRTVINLANDSPVPVGVVAVGDELAWETVFREALHRSYLYLWYLRYELGVTDWAVSSDLGYERAWHLDFDEAIPNTIEANFPPLPYLREGRRLAEPAMTWRDITDRARGTRRFRRSVMIGAYATDFHGCPPAAGEASGYGPYEVPLDVFVPIGVDGFLPGLARAGRVDRAVASSIRMQPTELLGGEVVGTLAALAVADGVPPRLVPVGRVRDVLAVRGAAVDLPEPDPLREKIRLGRPVP